MSTIWMSPGRAARLKQAYEAHLDSAGRDGPFVFQGHALDLGYVYYLLEFLSERFGMPHLKSDKGRPESERRD